MLYANKEYEKHVTKIVFLRRLRVLLKNAAILSGIVIGLGAAGAWFFVDKSKIEPYIQLKSEEFGYVFEDLEIPENIENCSSEEIAKTFDSYRGTSIFLLSLDDLKQNIDTIDCVENVNLKKIFPSSISVEVKSKNPIAIWQSNRQFKFISNDGKSFGIRGVENLDKFIIVVGKDAPEHAAKLLEFLSLDQDLFVNISSAVRVGSRRWDILFKNGTRVLLPEENPNVAWERLLNLISSKQEFKDWKYKIIDLRVPKKVYAK